VVKNKEFGLMRWILLAEIIVEFIIGCAGINCPQKKYCRSESNFLQNEVNGISSLLIKTNDLADSK